MRTLVDLARSNRRVCPSCKYWAKLCSHSQYVWARSTTYHISLNVNHETQYAHLEEQTMHTRGSWTKVMSGGASCI